MNTPVWAVMNWQPVMTTTHELLGAARRMRLLGAHVQLRQDEYLTQGQLLWGAELEAGRVGLAWEFIEFQEDCFAMADPMTVLSNAVINDLPDETQQVQSRLLWLNNVIHEIHWPGAVCRSVRLQRRRHRSVGARHLPLLANAA